MKILVPLRNNEQIDIYSLAGADEFYFGFFDKKWFDNFGTDMNRMSSMGSKANAFDIRDVCSVVEYIHKKQKKCYITLNANTYSKKEIEYIVYILNAGFLGAVDGIIFSDFRLISIIVKNNYKPIASTMTAIYNQDIVRFYYELGVRRMILPRELSIEEIGRIIKAFPDVEFEVFGMRDGCMFSDSNCLCVHRENFGGICSFIRKSDYELLTELETDTVKKMRRKLALYNDCMLSNACGLCAIFDFYTMNVNSIKIVGRADRTIEVEKDIKYVKENIKLASEVASQAEYLKKMRIPNRWKTACGLSCYYPEISNL